MFQKRANVVLAILLAFVVIFALTGCEKLKVSNLRANYYFSQANRYFTDQMYRRAIADYEKALASNPGLTQAYRFLGESYKNLYKPGDASADNKEKAEKALAAMNKAYEIEPNNKEVIYSLGDMYDKMRKFDEAEKMYLRILELEPGNMGNYYVVAEFYKRYVNDKPEVKAKAESMYLKRIEADPENPQGYAYMANYFESQDPTPENYDRANEYWDKSIQLDPNSAEAWLAKGVNRWSRSYRFQNLAQEERLRTANESLKALQKANELDANYPEPYSWLSVIYQSVLAKLEPEKEARYTAEGARALERFQDLRKRAAERKKLEEELKKTK